MVCGGEKPSPLNVAGIDQTAVGTGVEDEMDAEFVIVKVVSEDERYVRDWVQMQL